MRLICPGCGAQYEIDDALVPATGRDVQCSACGHAWFQYPTETAENGAPRQALADSAPPPAPETAASQGAEAKDPAPEAPRRPIDPAVADVLRAEAAHEERLRAQEAAQAPPAPDTPPVEPSSPETRPAPPEHTAEPTPSGAALPPQAPSTSGRRARMGAAARTAQTGDRDRGTGPGGKAWAESTRGGLLPDIESISSTLKPDDAHRDGAAGTQNSDANADARSGFVQGFTAVITAMLALVLLYMFAAQLAQAVPPLEAPLAGYVRLVDSALAWAAGLIDSVTVWLRGTD